MKVNWNMPPKKSGSSCFQTVDECWDYVANFAWKNTKMPKPVSAFKFAFPLCILSSLFAHLRWETPWLHQQEGCGWVVLLGHKSRCAIFFPKKKEKKTKTAVVSCLNLFPVPHFSLSHYGELEFVPKKQTLRTACSASTLPSPLPLASHLAAD